MNPNAPPSELKTEMWSLKPYFMRAFWFSMVSSLLVLAPSGYMLEVYERVVNSRNHTTLLMLTILVLAAFLVMEVIDWARSEVLHSASHVLDRKLSGRVMQAMFDANLQKNMPSSIQPMNDFRTVREFVYSPVVLAAMETPSAVVFLILIFAISPVLGWAAVVGALVQTLVAWLNERSTQPPLMAANRMAIASQQYADGSLRNAQVIEAMGMLDNIHARWIKRQREFLRLQAFASDKAGLYMSMSRLVQNVMGSLLLGLGAWLFLKNMLNGGEVMMIISSILGGRVLAPLVQIVTQWRGAINARDAWGRLDKLLAMSPARAPSMPLPAPAGRLAVEAVHAGAPGSPVLIVRGLNFALNPGEVLAVVGPSASGKTTLARLLVGLWPAASGKVRLDGVDVYAWDKNELGPHLGYLPQGVELFDGTVEENIARFGEVDSEKVQAAATAVGMHELIMALPEGYQTRIGTDGATLSGGQRQRVALARAIYGDPVFVVLDEPNSSLDEAGDRALAQAIQTLKSRGTTFVVITHRTSVLGVTDKMLIMRDGQAQAFGPRDEVMAALNQANRKPQGQPANAVAVAAQP